MMHTEASYRAYWATTAHLHPSEVYVPEAIRTPRRVEITTGLSQGVQGEVVTETQPGLFKIQWDDGVVSYISKEDSHWWRFVQ